MPRGRKLGVSLYLIYVTNIANLFNFAKIKVNADDLTLKICVCINEKIGRVKFQNELDMF